jgi:hypothetical protein
MHCKIVLGRKIPHELDALKWKAIGRRREDVLYIGSNNYENFSKHIQTLYVCICINDDYGISNCFCFYCRKMEESVSASVTDCGETDLALEGDETSKPDLHNMNDEDNQPVEDTGKEEVARNNPYAYLDRADFTSEKFKIEIRGLPKFYGIGVGLLLYYLERYIFCKVVQFCVISISVNTKYVHN